MPVIFEYGQNSGMQEPSQFAFIVFIHGLCPQLWQGRVEKTPPLPLDTREASLGMDTASVQIDGPHSIGQERAVQSETGYPLMPGNPAAERRAVGSQLLPASTTPSHASYSSTSLFMFLPSGMLQMQESCVTQGRLHLVA